MWLRNPVSAMALLAVTLAAAAQPAPSIDQAAFEAWRAHCLTQRRTDCDSTDAFLAETQPRASDVRVRPTWKPHPVPQPPAPPPPRPTTETSRKFKSN